MRNVIAIIRKELYSYFFSPIVWVVSAVVLMLLVPTLTMRLLAEEHNQGTMELLLTRPVTVTQLVLGKYFASLIVLFLMLCCTGLFPLMLSIYGTVDTGPLHTGYLLTFLVGASFLAMGLFASSLTTSQLIAAIVAFGGNLFFWITAWISRSFGDDWKVAMKVLEHLSIPSHF